MRNPRAMEFVRTFLGALIVIVALPLAYRVYIHFWPPEEKPRHSLAQFLEEAKCERCVKLLAKPVAKWTDAEMKAEPEVYAWLKEQGSVVLPWEWTEEARRKDPKGYAKCWLRVLRERRASFEKLLSSSTKELRRLDKELQTLVTIHAHRTNQIARLRALAATNAFPCQITLERLEKGRFWGWNKRTEVVECNGAEAIMAPTNGVFGKESATAHDETRGICALAESISAAKERSTVCEKALEICDQDIRLVETGSLHDEALKKSLVENLKAAAR